MARINVEDELRVDPRFLALCAEIGRVEAYGSIICFWEVGMAYWKKNKGLIPTKVFELVRHGPELLRCGFGLASENGVYCCGAEERWGFLLSKSEAGRRGGIASAKARIEKNGTAIPSNASNSIDGRSKPNPSSSSSSSSSYSSIKKKKPKPLILEEILLNQNYITKYPKEFLTQEVGMCIEYWYAKHGIEADTFNFKSWMISKGVKERWENFRRSHQDTSACVAPDEDVL